MNLGQITQALIYDQDREMRGLIDEMTIQDVEMTEVEHSALGMVGVLTLPGRPVRPIRATFTLSWLDQAIERQLMNPNILHDWQIHQKVDVTTPDGFSFDASYTLVHHVRFRLMKRGSVSTKLGEKATTEYDMTAPYYRQFVQGDNAAILFLDVMNNVYEVNGSPVWPA